MRTNSCNVTENAEFNVDREKFKEGHERVFGPEPKKFCDKCDMRLAFCQCCTSCDYYGELHLNCPKCQEKNK